MPLPELKPVASRRRQRPYSVLLGADAYTHSPRPEITDTLSWSTSSGWSTIKSYGRPPSLRFRADHSCGDFDLHIGQDVSIGYLSHTDAAVRLYLQETFTFLLLTTEAAVALAPPQTQRRLDARLGSSTANLSDYCGNCGIPPKERRQLAMLNHSSLW